MQKNSRLKKKKYSLVNKADADVQEWWDSGHQ